MALISLLGGIRATVFAALFLLASLWAGWQTMALDRVQGGYDAHLAADAAAALTASEDARMQEQASAGRVATIGDKLEEDRTHAETVPATVAADLRNGNLKLRKQWAACETSLLSSAAASAVERDALAASRDEAVGRIVRIGRDADDQLRACQAVVIADRSPAK